MLPKGARVWVQADIEPLDQYGRSLLFVYTDDGTNVNLELLREGAAEVEMYEPNVLLRDQVVAAEDSARDADRGLWGACR
jgi:micrococcal nuclease